MIAILYKKRLIIVLAVLFIIPLFWFNHNEMDYGGDSNRIFMYDPGTWLENIVYYSIPSYSSLGKSMPHFCFLPNILLLKFVKSVLGDSEFALNWFCNGTLLSFSFLFSFLCMVEILKHFHGRGNAVNLSIAAGLFFVFSPITNGTWVRALFHFPYIAIFPLVFFLFLKAINSSDSRYVVYGALSALLFSNTFCFSSTPYFVGFFGFAVPFCYFYAVILKKCGWFIKQLVIFFTLFIAIKMFHWLPEIGHTFLFQSDSGFITVMDVNRGLHYFKAMKQFFSMFYDILNQPHYATNNFHVKLITQMGLREVMILSFIFPVTLSLFWIISYRNVGKIGKKISLLAFAFFLILLLCISPFSNSLFSVFVGKLFYLPGFSMFRDPYGKLFYVFTFFYSMVMAMSLFGLRDRLVLKKFNILYFIIIFCILLNAVPLISGKIFHMPFNQSRDIRGTIEIGEDYEAFIDKSRKLKLDARILGMPLDDSGNERLKGKYGGIYIGSSVFSILTGRKSIMGLGAFGEYAPMITDILKDKHGIYFKAFMPGFNLGYVFHNRDEYIFLKNFPGWFPYGAEIKKAFPDSNSVNEFIQFLDYKKKCIDSDDYIIYSQSGKKDFLPHFYIATDVLSIVREWRKSN